MAGNMKLPYLNFYIGDWVKDTRMLSLEARAIWMDLLCLMHDSDRRGYLTRNGKPLTAEQIGQFCGCSADVAARAVQELVTSGVASSSDGILYCRRMVRDGEKPVVNGRKAKSAQGEGFDAFWSAYPRKTAKQAAVSAWNSLAPGPEVRSALMTALEQQKKWYAWTKENGRFVPHPATWLNGRRWEDQETKGLANGKQTRRGLYEDDSDYRGNPPHDPEGGFEAGPG